MMKFLLMVNKQGQTRLAQYFDFKSIEERTALESEIIRKCLSRTEMQCSFMEHRGLKVVYRRYASLYFIVGFEEGEENELGMLEFIHALVETLDKYFENVVSVTPVLGLFLLAVRGSQKHLVSDCIAAPATTWCVIAVRARYHVQPGTSTLYC